MVRIIQFLSICYLYFACSQYAGAPGSTPVILDYTGNYTNETSDSLLKLSAKYIGIDNDIALIYAQKGFQQIADTSRKDGFIDYYLINGQVAYFKDQYEKALLYLDSAKALIIRGNFPKKLADYYFHYARVNACMGNYPKALESSLASIRVREKINDTRGIIMCEGYLGAIYHNLGDLEKAKKYYYGVLAKSKNADNQMIYATTLINISKIKMEQDSLEEAFRSVSEAYGIFLSAGKLRNLASALVRMGEIHSKLGENNAAVREFNEAESIYNKLEEKYGLTAVYHYTSQAYFNLNNPDSSLSYSLRANNLAYKIQNQPLISETSLQLSKTYKMKGDFKKALACFEKYDALNTSILSTENNQQILFIEYQAQIASKDKDIQILTQNNQIKKQNNTNLIIILIAVALLSVLTIIVLRMKNLTLKQQRKLLEKNNKIIKNENRIHEQEKVILENDLELKNKELASKALALMQLNETLKVVGNKINSMSRGEAPMKPDFSKKIMNDIQLASHNNIWKEFNMAFNKVHNHFYEKLFDICPNLTSSEIKIAALLKLNLSTKEIAALTYKTESSIKTARHRLRHKMQLGKDENLISFLLKL